MQIIEVVEGQRSRERKIVSLVQKFCSGLYLHSRSGAGLERTFLPRLRFDKRRYFRWFFFLFSGEPFPSALVITAVGLRALNLRHGWIPIEIHCHDERLVTAAEKIAKAYRDEFGFAARIILDPISRADRWGVVMRIFAAVSVIITLVIGFRVASMLLFQNFIASIF